MVLRGLLRKSTDSNALAIQDQILIIGTLHFELSHSLKLRCNFDRQRTD